MQICSFFSSMAIRLSTESESTMPVEMTHSSSRTGRLATATTASRAACRIVSGSSTILSLHDGERPLLFEKTVASIAARYFPGCALDDPALWNHPDEARRYAERRDDQALNFFLHAVDFGGIELAAHFCDDANALCSEFLVIDAECDDPTRIDSGNLRRDDLDVFGEDVLTGDDDNVLHPADDEHFFVRRESEIPAAIPSIFGERVTAKSITIPVTFEKAGCFELDFASHKIRTGQAVRPDDSKPHPFEATARRNIFIVDKLKRVGRAGQRGSFHLGAGDCGQGLTG